RCDDCPDMVMGVWDYFPKVYPNKVVISHNHSVPSDVPTVRLQFDSPTQSRSELLHPLKWQSFLNFLNSQRDIERTSISRGYDSDDGVLPSQEGREYYTSSADDEQSWFRIDDDEDTFGSGGRDLRLSEEEDGRGVLI
ncbi:hypothetical protein FOZ63_022133, partial [Perkinsus olseni]